MTGSDGAENTFVYAISGRYVVGRDSNQTDGVRWNLDTGEITSYDHKLTEVNAAGNVTGGQNWSASSIHAGGSEVSLPHLDGERQRVVRVLFEPDGQASAAGWAYNEQNRLQPVIWTGC